MSVILLAGKSHRKFVTAVIGQWNPDLAAGGHLNRAKTDMTLQFLCYTGIAQARTASDPANKQDCMHASHRRIAIASKGHQRHEVRVLRVETTSTCIAPAPSSSRWQ
eukprot:3356699-Amphidinium_carterae.1